MDTSAGINERASRQQLRTRRLRRAVGARPAAGTVGDRFRQSLCHRGVAPVRRGRLSRCATWGDCPAAARAKRLNKGGPYAEFFPEVLEISTGRFHVDYAYHLAPLDKTQIAELTSANPARRFGLSSKGDLAPGYDADIVLVDEKRGFVVRAAESESRQGYTPFEGIEMTAKVAGTYLRGTLIYDGANVIGEPGGRYLKRPC